MKKFASTLLGLLLGAALGLPLSYYAQPGLVQMKFSLPEYLGQLPRIFEGADPDYVAPVLLTCLVCALVLGALLFAGLGYGRNATGMLSLRGRLEGGYRLATQLSDCSYEFEDGGGASTSFESEGQAFDTSGPFLRLVIGI